MSSRWLLNTSFLPSGNEVGGWPTPYVNKIVQYNVYCHHYFPYMIVLCLSVGANTGHLHGRCTQTVGRRSSDCFFFYAVYASRGVTVTETQRHLQRMSILPGPVFWRRLSVRVPRRHNHFSGGVWLWSPAPSTLISFLAFTLETY